MRVAPSSALYLQNIIPVGLAAEKGVAPSSVPVHPVQHPEVPVRPVQHTKDPVRPVLPENQEETEHQGLRSGQRSTNSKTTIRGESFTEGLGDVFFQFSGIIFF